MAAMDSISRPMAGLASLVALESIGHLDIAMGWLLFAACYGGSRLKTDFQPFEISCNHSRDISFFSLNFRLGFHCFEFSFLYLLSLQFVWVSLLLLVFKKLSFWPNPIVLMLTAM